ncbi:MAG: molybdopterin molybdenumtransferase MoeA, partial [Nitrospirae bacterium]|nr:molybdopterin molybdenumtransferase MoeA [Nitrospirota bacterium]
MRSVEDALKTVLANTKTLGTERIAIQDSYSRVLAEDVSSGLFHPPWDNSAMDGFAVRWADIKEASKDKPVQLRIVGDLRAGSMPDRPANNGEAIRIMTGAPVPDGADSVVRVEDTKSEGDVVRIYYSGKKGENVRKKGENIKKGDIVLAKGTVLGAAQTGVMAMVWKPVVTVYRRP